MVQIDAHGDMRFEYEGSHHNHACVMRRVLEMGLPTLPVGIRAICREETADSRDLGSRYPQGCGVMLLSPTQLSGACNFNHFSWRDYI